MWTTRHNECEPGQRHSNKKYRFRPNEYLSETWKDDRTYGERYDQLVDTGELKRFERRQDGGSNGNFLGRISPVKKQEMQIEALKEATLSVKEMYGEENIISGQ